jgi:hypothetical protein
MPASSAMIATMSGFVVTTAPPLPFKTANPQPARSRCYSMRAKCASELLLGDSNRWSCLTKTRFEPSFASGIRRRFTLPRLLEYIRHSRRP